MWILLQAFVKHMIFGAFMNFDTEEGEIIQLKTVIIYIVCEY